MRAVLREKCEKYCKHFSELLGVDCVYLDVERLELSTPNKQYGICSKCTYAQKDRLKLSIYSCCEANRWNGRYIYDCPIGATFVATAISDDMGGPIGGLILGPLLMGELQDVIQQYPHAEQELRSLKHFSTQEVRDISEIMCCVTSEISSAAGQKLRNLFYQQDKILNNIYQVKDSDESSFKAEVWLSYEKQMQESILHGRKDEAESILNQAISYIMGTQDMGACKARVLEILVLLSRASIAAGASAEEIFHLSEGFIHQWGCFKASISLDNWIIEILHRYLDQIFDFTQIKHSGMVYKVVEYIRKHYNEKIVLDQLAKEVCLSRSYLSSIFKQEMNMSITEYISQVRVTKSKQLLAEEQTGLAEIAALCGFEDQSYFTKVFKKVTGMSPKTYRESYSRPD